mmetsp:Transcript_17243/g.25486  ORF Transcript_17243/g.25486 Transcript_17243/m.25486 type:complete len:205 (+) Transcript_17243:203-817(+)
MRLTVVFIGTSLIELHGEGVALLSQLFRHGDSFLGHAVGDSIFVEDNIVWASLVVDPLNGITLTNGGFGWNEDKKATISTHLNLLRFSSVCRRGSRSSGNSRSHTSSLSHGSAAGTVIVRSDNYIHLLLKLVPIKRCRKLRAHFVLECTIRRRITDNTTACATTTCVPSRALSARKQRKELAFSPNHNLEVEMLNCITVRGVID